MSGSMGVDPLNYEINLECDRCGHPQFLHCDNHENPCGCVSAHLVHTSVIPAPRVARNCMCPGFVRPASALPADPGFWRNHGCEEAG